MQLVLATKNIDKVREIKKVLAGLKLQIKTLDNFTGKLSESGKTFKANAKEKAKYVNKLTGLPALADDSGLEVKYLKGKPGINSSRFAGHKATYRDNYFKLLKLLRNVPFKKRKAVFRCVIALALSQKKIYTAEGICSGYITEEPTGNKGFGYDPVFYIPNLKKTFARLSTKEKNRISHRGKALRKARKLIVKHLLKT